MSEPDIKDDFRGYIFKTLLTLSQLVAFIYLIFNVDLALARNVIAIAIVPPLVYILGMLTYSYFFE